MRWRRSSGGLREGSEGSEAHGRARLAVGALAIAAHVGLRFVLDQLPEPANGNPNIARVVMEPMLDVLLPILFVALVQTVTVLFSLTRRGPGTRKPATARWSE